MNSRPTVFSAKMLTRFLIGHKNFFWKKRTEIHSSNYESNHKTKCLCTFWCSAAAHDQMSFQVQICKITHFFPGAKTHVATKLLFFTKNFQSSNLESRMKEGHKNWGFKTYCNSKKLDLITGENLRSVYGPPGMEYQLYRFTHPPSLARNNHWAIFEH